MSLLELSIKGMRKRLEGQSKTLIFREIYQNAVDTDAKVIRATLARLEDQPRLAVLTFEDDDPEGFKRLSDAYTLFDESLKGADPTKRGRFNQGEKDVIVLAEEVTIQTTKGTIHFDVLKNERTESRKRREAGSLFTGVFRLTKTELEEIEAYVQTLLPPTSAQVFFNGTLLLPKSPAHTFETTLPTVRTDDEGVPRPTERKTRVHLHEVSRGDVARIYELGIPVVALDGGEKYHVDVQQKVPLNADRDNVPPSYLRKLRTLVLNETASILEPDDLAAKWVDAGLEGKDVTPEALQAVVTGRFGDKVAGATPFDKESEDMAKSLGFAIVPTRAFSKEARDNFREKAPDAIPPATKVAPSQREKEDKLSRFVAIPEEKWTKDQQRIAAYSMDVARQLMDVEISVRIVSAPGSDVVACYGPEGEKKGRLTFNHGHQVMGDRWFARPVIDVKVNDLVLHELGHHYEGNHLNVGYHGALTLLGAKLAKLAFETPAFFVEKGATKPTNEQLAKRR